MATQQQLPEALRRDQILNVGLDMVREEGFTSITCASVALRCACSYKTVERLFRNRELLCKAIVEYAEKLEDAEVVKIARRIWG